jgi:hypothetical protein
MVKRQILTSKREALGTLIVLVGIGIGLIIYVKRIITGKPLILFYLVYFGLFYFTFLYIFSGYSILLLFYLFIFIFCFILFFLFLFVSFAFLFCFKLFLFYFILFLLFLIVLTPASVTSQGDYWYWVVIFSVSILFSSMEQVWQEKSFKGKHHSFSPPLPVPLLSPSIFFFVFVLVVVLFRARCMRRSAMFVLVQFTLSSGLSVGDSV